MDRTVEDLYKAYNPQTSGEPTANKDEKFIKEGDVDVDENSNFDEHLQDEDDNLEEAENLSPEMIGKMLELPDEQLAKYGIDNPKQWKSYQRAFTKANQENKSLKSKLAQLETNNGNANEIAELRQQLTELKNPQNQSKPLERPTRPQLPRKPAGFNYSNASEQGTAEYAYMQEKLDYDEKLAIYNEQYEMYNEKVNAQHRQLVENESKITRRSLEQQQIKANMVSRLTKLDLSPAEAAAAFEMALKPEFYDEKLIATGYKMKMGKKIETEKEERGGKRFNKREKFFAPGVGGGNNAGGSKGEFSSSKDTSNFYKTVKQG